MLCIPTLLITWHLTFNWQHQYDVLRSAPSLSAWIGDRAQHFSAEASSFQACRLGASAEASHASPCNCCSSRKLVSWRVSSSLQHQSGCKHFVNWIWRWDVALKVSIWQQYCKSLFLTHNQHCSICLIMNNNVLATPSVFLCFIVSNLDIH